MNVLPIENKPYSGRKAAFWTMVLVCFLLSACSMRDNQAALEAARAVITKDPNLEIVATDERTRVFTVRVKSTGQLVMVKADDIQRLSSSAAQGQGQTAPAKQALVQRDAPAARSPFSGDGGETPDWEERDAVASDQSNPSAGEGAGIVARIGSTLARLRDIGQGLLIETNKGESVVIGNGQIKATDGKEPVTLHGPIRLDGPDMSFSIGGKPEATKAANDSKNPATPSESKEHTQPSPSAPGQLAAAPLDRTGHV